MESHGIVDNYMWDEDTGDTFELGANPEALQSHWYEFAEPLWVTSTKQVSVFFMQTLHTGQGKCILGNPGVTHSVPTAFECSGYG